jgi:hypothetical protein
MDDRSCLALKNRYRKAKNVKANIKVNSAPGALDPSSNLCPCPILDKLESKKIPSINKNTPNNPK